MAADFKSPPDSTKPRTYWYWIDGKITKYGITRDLEAMKKIGIGEAYIGILGGEAGDTGPGDGVSRFSVTIDDWPRVRELLQTRLAGYGDRPVLFRSMRS